MFSSQQQQEQSFPPPYPEDDSHFHHAKLYESLSATHGVPESPSGQPKPTSANYSQSSEDLVLLQALAFTKQAGRIPSNLPPIPKSIAIPQTTPGTGESFLRAYAPILQSKNISQTDFIAFIDNLNVVATANPPLQVLDLAGGLLGMIPYHWAQLAGGLVQASAKIGVAAVSKGRTEIYMREVNKLLFNPRGLKGSIASSAAMRKILRVPPGVSQLQPLSEETLHMSIAERAFQVVAPYAASLDLNIPDPAEQTTVLAKLSARQVASREKRNHEKLLKARQKQIEKEGERMRKEEKKREKRDEKYAKKDEKRENKGRKKRKEVVSSEDEVMAQRVIVSKGQREDKESKRDKEAKKASKLLWLIIENI